MADLRFLDRLEQAQRIQGRTEDRKFLREDRASQAAARQAAIPTDEERAASLQQLQFKNEKEVFDYFEESAPFVTFDNYAESAQHFIELGANPAIFPESFETEEDYDKWKSDSLAYMDKQKAAIKEPGETADRALEERRVKVSEKRLTLDEKKLANDLKKGGSGVKKMTKDAARKEFVKTAQSISRLKTTGSIDPLMLAFLSEKKQEELLDKADSKEAIRVLEQYQAVLKKEHGLELGDESAVDTDVYNWRADLPQNVR